MKLSPFCCVTPSQRTLIAAACLGLLFAAPCLNAQSKAPPKTQQAAAAPIFDATHLHGPTSLDDAAWLVHGGDDPAYARPDFDDSHWTPVDMRKSLKTTFPNSHPEVVWYRLRIKVPLDQTGLSLEAYEVSFAFEIYANGQRILQSGQVAPFMSYTDGARLLVRIPDAQVATGTVIIAERVHLSTLDWDMPHPGGGSPRLGQENALREHIWLISIGQKSLKQLDAQA